MVGLIYNVGNIIIKQGIHNLCHCAVFGQFVNVMLDVGIQILQAGDQKIRVFPDLHQHDSRLVHGSSHKAVYGINVALVLDLFAVCNVQQRLNHLHCILFEIHSLHIAFVCLHFDPAVIFQTAQDSVGAAPAVICLEFLFHQLGCIFLVKIKFQFICQHLSFHSKGKLMFHDGKKPADTFPVYNSVG